MSAHEPASAGYRPTTTHAAWGAGHPRLLVASDYGRYVHEIDCDMTRIGSSDDNELLLQATDPVHAKVMHDPADEYQLEMLGEGETSHGREATLRTGAHFTAGPWRLVFARDEYADHGRPYGGRNGGEGAHQKRQAPRPDYAKEQPVSGGTRCELKRADQTTGPDQLAALGRAVLADAAEDASTDQATELRVVKDEQAGLYEATLGDREVGGVTYNLDGDERIVLLAVSVFPQFRGQGVATELIRRVLDDVRAEGKTVTNYCPVVATFVEDYPDYADLIDREHPGPYAMRSPR